MGTKQCRDCLQVRDLYEFSVDNSTKSKLSTRCKDCQRRKRESSVVGLYGGPGHTEGAFDLVSEMNLAAGRMGIKKSLPPKIDYDEKARLYMQDK